MINKEDFKKLTQLCRITCDEDSEVDLFVKGLNDALSYVEKLQEINTDGVSPCFTVHENLSSVLREDIPEEPLSREAFLSNVPSSIAGFVQVPSVLSAEE